MTLSDRPEFKCIRLRLLCSFGVDLTSSLTKNHKSAEYIIQNGIFAASSLTQVNVSAANGLLHSSEIAFHCKSLIFIPIEMDSATNALWQLIYWNIISRIIEFLVQCTCGTLHVIWLLYLGIPRIYSPINLIFRIQLKIERVLVRFSSIRFNIRSNYLYEINIDV